MFAFVRHWLVCDGNHVMGWESANYVMGWDSANHVGCRRERKLCHGVGGHKSYVMGCRDSANHVMGWDSANLCKSTHVQTWPLQISNAV